jgi:phage-related protein
MRGRAPSRERPLHWVGSSRRDLLAFPEALVDDFGYFLGVVQFGGMPPSAKPWKGEGSGVFELVEQAHGDAFRVVYTVHFERAIYVLHCCQKKSPSGRRTASSDVSLIHRRLKTAREDYEARYGQEG